MSAAVAFSRKQDRVWTSVHDQYKSIEVLGQGTYGVVYKASNRMTGELVALKRCRLDAFREFGIPETTLREISLLRDLKHDNIMSLHQTSCNTDRLYMVCQYLEMDLKKYIRANPKGISLKKAKEISFEIFKGLAFCHGHRVLHRDLKPHNVLVSSDATEVKIADFGLARSCLAPGKTLTHEVITLWYRAPELLLGHCNYTDGVDIWSAGCIVAELLNCKPLFAGDSEIDTLFKIFRTLGTPDKSEWPANSMAKFSDFPQFENKLDPFSYLSSELDNNGKDFLTKVFKFDSSKRISALEALHHPWFDDVRTPNTDKPEYLEWAKSSQQQIAGGAGGRARVSSSRQTTVCDISVGREMEMRKSSQSNSTNSISRAKIQENHKNCNNSNNNNNNSSVDIEMESNHPNIITLNSQQPTASGCYDDDNNINDNVDINNDIEDPAEAVSRMAKKMRDLESKLKELERISNKGYISSTTTTTTTTDLTLSTTTTTRESTGGGGVRRGRSLSSSSRIQQQQQKHHQQCGLNNETRMNGNQVEDIGIVPDLMQSDGRHLCQDIPLCLKPNSTKHSSNQLTDAPTELLTGFQRRMAGNTRKSVAGFVRNNREGVIGSVGGGAMGQSHSNDHDKVYVEGNGIKQQNRRNTVGGISELVDILRRDSSSTTDNTTTNNNNASTTNTNNNTNQSEGGKTAGGGVETGKVKSTFGRLGHQKEWEILGMLRRSSLGTLIDRRRKKDDKRSATANNRNNNNNNTQISTTTTNNNSTRNSTATTTTTTNTAAQSNKLSTGGGKTETQSGISEPPMNLIQQKTAQTSSLSINNNNNISQHQHYHPNVQQQPSHHQHISNVIKTNVEELLLPSSSVPDPLTTIGNNINNNNGDDDTCRIHNEILQRRLRCLSTASSQSSRGMSDGYWAGSSSRDEGLIGTSSQISSSRTRALHQFQLRRTLSNQSGLGIDGIGQGRNHNLISLGGGVGGGATVFRDSSDIFNSNNDVVVVSNGRGRRPLISRMMSGGGGGGSMLDERRDLGNHRQGYHHHHHHRNNKNAATGMVGSTTTTTTQDQRAEGGEKRETVGGGSGADLFKSIRKTPRRHTIGLGRAANQRQ